MLSPRCACAARVRNQDGDPIASDSTYFVKNTACPNQKGLPLTPPPTPAPPVTTAAPSTTAAAVVPPPPVVPPPVVSAHPDPLDIVGDINAAKNVAGSILGK